MSRVGLRQIFGRQSEARALVSTIVDAMGGAVSVEDADGRLLHGEVPTGEDVRRFPVMFDSTEVGRVSGPSGAAAVAALLTHLIARDVERKALGAEVLHLYREINLIYSFSEKLASLLDVQRVAQLTLTEARQVIVATDGVVMLLDEPAEALSVVVGFGDELHALPPWPIGRGILGAVAASGLGEIVNDLDRDVRRTLEQTLLKALICAPLKVGERVIGLIALGSTVPMAYTAAELKLLNTLALQTATAIENARLFERAMQAARERERLMALHQATEVARAKLESELTLAARIQADLFPAALPQLDGYEMSARNRPARRCGGDYYDVLQVTSGHAGDRLLLCVADVSGKGLPAALVMSNMQATLRALLGRTESLPVLAGHASELLFGSTSAEKYVTAALVELVPSSGGLTFLGAGHLDNVILRGDGSTAPLASTGPPLGLLPPGLPFLQTDARLEPGDSLVLFSDGITDAQNADGEEFGEARLRDLLRDAAGASATAMIDRLFDAISAFVGDAPQFDDMTVLVARRLPAS
jgi:serine phosphatase RsbU (regulator of sigma subunit)